MPVTEIVKPGLVHRRDFSAFREAIRHKKEAPTPVRMPWASRYLDRYTRAVNQAK
jgi:hypothetical protein